MVRLVAGVEELIQKGGEEVAKQAVELAPLYTPESSGRLVHSITVTQVDHFKWRVSTHAYGDNGFEYAARIEAGQGVVATQAKVLHFKVHGRDIYAKSVGASKKSHFMKNTKSNLHI